MAKGSSEKKGKTYIEMYGVKRAAEIIMTKRKKMIGKNSKRMKELWSDLDYRKNMVEKHIGKIQSETSRKKKSIAMIGFKHSEATILKMMKPKTKIHSENISKGILKYYSKTNISKAPYSNNWTLTLKKMIRGRDNYKCQLCDKYGNVIHHIDYNKMNCHPDNLICLCRSCHGRTNHNHAKWKRIFERHAKEVEK